MRRSTLPLALSLLSLAGCDGADIELGSDDRELDLAAMVADSGHDLDGDLPAAPRTDAAPALAEPPDPTHFQICPSLPAPSIERAWKINQKGYLDTSVSFASFFDAPHTVMGWVMPEFTFNESGPIFGENGGGVYVVGQGDYRDGTGGFQQGGDPVLHVSVGGKSVNYLAPGYKKREWNHVALVRTAADASGNYRFQLYVNGVLLTPMTIVIVNGEKQVQSAPEISFGPASPMPAAQKPQGTLRFGRRTSGLGTTSSKSWQFYGLIDEVAVFNAALTSAQIALYKLCGFGGSEAGLVAGLTFDLYAAADPAGPKIVEPIAPVAPVSSFVRRVGVATGSKPSNASDAGLFDSAFYVAPAQASYQLPFPAGEEWRVVQGPDDPDGSHNGYAAFCWDFARVTGPALATVTAAADGDIVEVLDTHVPPAGEREGNKVRIKTAQDEFLLYLHQQHGTFEEVFMDGDPLLFLPQAGEQFWIPVEQGTALAKVGQNAEHLHLDANDGTLTMPIAFTGYEVKDTSVNPPVWKPVLRGQPKAGEIIRRQ